MLRFLVVLLSVSSIWAASLDGLKAVPVRDIGPRIVNGEAAEDGQLPWQVAIMGRSAAVPLYLCGGALISEEWVLTAGHCVDGARSATIYSGSVKIDSPNRTVSQSTTFILHEEYDGVYLTNDIGLIKLDKPVTFNDNIQAIALAEDELGADVAVTVSGWGSVSDNDPDPYAETLYYINVSTIENSDCVRTYGSQIVYPGLVCTATGDPLKSPCLGDSGAPVVANADTDPLHVAVFSFVNGYGCEYPFPAGNTRTAYYRDWIRENTGI